MKHAFFDFEAALSGSDSGDEPSLSSNSQFESFDVLPATGQNVSVPNEQDNTEAFGDSSYASAMQHLGLGDAGELSQASDQARSQDLGLHTAQGILLLWFSPSPNSQRVIV